MNLKASSHDRRCRDDGLLAYMYLCEVCRKLCVDAGFKISSWQQCFRSRTLRRISVICMRVPTAGQRHGRGNLEFRIRADGRREQKRREENQSVCDHRVEAVVRRHRRHRQPQGLWLEAHTRKIPRKRNSDSRASLWRLSD